MVVIEPRFTPGVIDESAHVRAGLRQPIGAQPLRDLVGSEDDVAIVFSDLTRPMPNDRVLPALLDELSYVPPENIVLINALGTHRRNTDAELRGMLGSAIVDKYRIVQHDCLDEDNLVHMGATRFGMKSGSVRRIWARKSGFLQDSSSRISWRALAAAPRRSCPE